MPPLEKLKCKLLMSEKLKSKLLSSQTLTETDRRMDRDNTICLFHHSLNGRGIIIGLFQPFIKQQEKLMQQPCDLHPHIPYKNFMCYI